MDQQLYYVMRDFAIRVLRGAGSPQEIAVLPDILILLNSMHEKENAASGN